MVDLISILIIAILLTIMAYEKLMTTTSRPKASEEIIDFKYFVHIIIRLQKSRNAKVAHYESLTSLQKQETYRVRKYSYSELNSSPELKTKRIRIKGVISNIRQTGDDHAGHGKGRLGARRGSVLVELVVSHSMKNLSDDIYIIFHKGVLNKASALGFSSGTSVEIIGKYHKIIKKRYDQILSFKGEEIKIVKPPDGTSSPT